MNSWLHHRMILVLASIKGVNFPVPTTFSVIFIHHVYSIMFLLANIEYFQKNLKSKFLNFIN